MYDYHLRVTQTCVRLLLALPFSCHRRHIRLDHGHRRPMPKQKQIESFSQYLSMKTGCVTTILFYWWIDDWIACKSHPNRPH